MDLSKCLYNKYVVPEISPLVSPTLRYNIIIFLYFPLNAYILKIYIVSRGDDLIVTDLSNTKCTTVEISVFMS